MTIGMALTTAGARNRSRLNWWEWSRAQAGLERHVRMLIGARPYEARFAPGGGSYMSFTRRIIVADPAMADRLCAEARRLPAPWGRGRLRSGVALQKRCTLAAIEHECGHVLFTEEPPGMGATLHHLWNSLEDRREEGLMAEYYPPARRNFDALGHLLWLGGMGGDSREARLLAACLYHRWDARRAPRAPGRLVLPGDEMRLWEGRVRSLVEEAWVSATSHIVADIARRILEILGVDPASDPATLPGLIPWVAVIPLGAPEGARSGDDPPLAPGPPPPPDGGPVPGVSGGDDDGLEGDPFSGDRSTEDCAADADPRGGRGWMRPFREVEARVRGQTDRIARELRVRAPDTAPYPDGRRGRYDARSDVRSDGERPFLRPADDSDAPDGIEVLIYIDGTGSMGGHPHGLAPDGGPAAPRSFESGRMAHVRPAVLALRNACARAGIPCAIALVANGIAPSPVDTLPRYASPPVHWIQTFETDPWADGPRALICGLSGRARYEAVVAGLAEARRVFARRRGGRPLLLYLHDGQPNDGEVACKAAVEQARRAGIITVGVYLGDQEDLPALQAIFGRDWTIGADDLAALAPQLGRVLKRFRVGG